MENGKSTSSQMILPGEQMATRQGHVLSAYSGASLVVCLHDGEKKIGGMAHFIVPGKISPGARAGDEMWAKGVAEMEILIGEMVKLGGDRRRIKASVYGAASVLPGMGPEFDEILVSNMRFLREYFAMEDIAVVADGLGGISRRLIDFNTSSGETQALPPPDGAALEEIAAKENEYIENAFNSSTPFGRVIYFDSVAYETLISLIPDVIYRIDHNGLFTYISDSIFKLGYEPAELVGRHFGVIVHPDDLGAVQRSLVLPRLTGTSTGESGAPKLFDERRTGKRLTKELKVRLVPARGARGGNYPVGEVISTGTYDIHEGGRDFRGTIGIIRDITDVASAERALMQTERFYRTILNGSSDMFVLMTMEGTILYINDSALHVTGHTPLDLIGENQLDFTHDEDRALLRNILESPLDVAYGTLIETRFRHAAGHWITIESTVYRIRDAAGASILIVLHSRDVTAQKQAEMKLRTILSEKEVLLKEIHHRVKNNLQIILSLLSLQAGRAEHEAVIKQLRESQSRVRAIALVHEKLYRSGDLAHINFDRYVHEVINELFTIYGVDRSKIGFDVDIGAMQLKIDKAIPCGLFVNEVVTNSLKYAFPPEQVREGKVRVAMYACADGWLNIRVSDNGVGLPDSVSTESEKSLGFFLIRLLATEQLRGELSIERRPGTAVSVRFRND